MAVRGTMQVDPHAGPAGGRVRGFEDNSRNTPVMLHRAIVGSLERFIGILFENYAGARAAGWLAPRQGTVASITSDQNGYAETVVNRLQGQPASGPRRT